MKRVHKKKSTQKNILVTGSCGLIGSEATKFFAGQGYRIYGIDNDMRQYFFGKEASTHWNQKNLESELKDNYVHINMDIRNNDKLQELFRSQHFSLIIHTAAQPSHDWAAKEPITDFSVNALATLYLLECFRKYCPEAAFIFTSTNKVYGDRPNSFPLIEGETRYELPRSHRYYKGIDETMSIDNTKHSIFGASKVAADVMVQEYGKYFGLKTCVFRGGCLTGPAHSGTRLHGFLAFLVGCIMTGERYTIIGYKGKQVRDNIHSHDLIAAFYEYFRRPTVGKIYNMGGSRYSNTSVLEAIALIQKISGKKAKTNYIVKPRNGDHQWYISDIGSFQSDYPSFRLTYNNEKIIEDICQHGHFS